jgi:hypothetical protein
MTDLTDPRVDACIDALPGWQEAICRDVGWSTPPTRRSSRPSSAPTAPTSRPCFVLEGCIPLRRGTVPDPEDRNCHAVSS